MFSEPLSQYEEILKDAIRTSMKESGAKLAKTFQTLLVEILTLYMILPRKINFTQMARYGKHCEQTYRQNFNRKHENSFLHIPFCFFDLLMGLGLVLLLVVARRCRLELPDGEERRLPTVFVRRLVVVIGLQAALPKVARRTLHWRRCSATSAAAGIVATGDSNTTTRRSGDGTDRTQLNRVDHRGLILLLCVIISYFF